MKNKKKIVVFVCISIIVGFVAYQFMKPPFSKTFDMGGGDEFKSLVAVVGDREVLTILDDHSVGNNAVGARYASRTVEDDLKKYADYLKNEEGFVFTKAMDFSDDESEFFMAKRSKDSELVVTFSAHTFNGGYIVLFEKDDKTMPNAVE